MSNTKKNYKKGYRYELSKYALLCGGVPYSMMSLLFGDNLLAARHKLNFMESEGIVEKYHDGPIWVYGLTLKGKETVLREFSEELPETIAEFSHYTQSSYYTLKNKSPKLAPRSYRIIKNSEAMLFFTACDINVYKEDKYPLESFNKKLGNTGFNSGNCYYTSREIKKTTNVLAPEFSEDAGKKIVNGTRLNGMLIMDSGTYSVINIGKETFHFSEIGEGKAKGYCMTTASNSNLPYYRGCMLLYSSEVPIAKLLNPKGTKEKIYSQNLFNAYNRDEVLAIPNDKFGTKMINLMKNPDWKNDLLSVCLSKEMLAQDKSRMFIDCDGADENGYHLIFMIPDLARLSKFITSAKLAAINQPDKTFYIYCYSHQTPILTALGITECKNIRRKSKDIDTVLSFIHK